ncbi:MAG: Ig-like domain-containing protein, partial [Candidatus Solibacter sp.]|nr:Ig-like domain-containing protein [Candidatus Solibacter sp.]
TIFAVRLRLIGLPGTSNSVCIGGTPTVIGAANFDLEPVPVGTVCGQLTVNRRPVAFSQSLTNAEDAPLAITLTGSDVDRPVTNFTVLSAPTNGTLSGTAPELTYLPATNYYGPDSFTFTVDDGSLTSEVATVSITITNVNDAPVLASISDRTVHAGSTLVITNRASDPDVPPQSLVFSLTAAPVGASIGTNDGVFRWTPGESYIDTTNSVTVRVADNGTPSLDDAKSFLIAVVARPLIESISLSNNIVWLTWSAISGQTYRVQFKEAWENPHWTNVAPDVRASGSTVSATNNVGSAAQKFYRGMLVQ